jgi:hypothetical protein
MRKKRDWIAQLTSPTKGLLIWLMLTTRWDVKPGGMDDSARSSNIRQN